MRHILLLLFLPLFLACAPSATPPDIPLAHSVGGSSNDQLAQEFSIPEPCKGLKFIGKLTPNDFRKLFACLDQDGALKPLDNTILGNPENTALFVDLYNETFSNNSERRNTLLQLVDSLEKNGGLSQALLFLSELISEFIDTPDFNQNLKALLSSVLDDNIDLLSLVKKVVTAHEFQELSPIIQKSFNEGTLIQNLKALGNFLRSKDSQNIGGDENLINLIQNISNLSSQNSPFGWDDVEALNSDNIPLLSLHTLYKMKNPIKSRADQKTGLEVLHELLKNMLHHTSASVLSADRMDRMKNNPDSLTPEQLAGSLQVLENYPANDLSTFIKLTSSLHRGFISEPDSGRNILSSTDEFLKGVKLFFDTNAPGGPNAEASRVMTVYSLSMNFAYLELMDPSFHALSSELKLQNYTTPTETLDNPSVDNLKNQMQSLKEEHLNTHTMLYALYSVRYQLYELTQAIATCETQKGSPLTRRETKACQDQFYADSFPVLQAAYKTYLDQSVQNVSDVFIQYPLLYDFLNELKKEGSLGLFTEKLLLNLDNGPIYSFIDNTITPKVLKKFFNYNKPVDQFVRIGVRPNSDATWLVETVELIENSGGDLPEQDQKTLIAVIESFQMLERLLGTENQLENIKDALLPFLKIIHAVDQDERILRLCQLISGSQESKSIMNQLSATLTQMVDSGFLMSSLNLAANLGQDADPINRVLTFLTRSKEGQRPIDPLLQTIVDLAQHHRDPLFNVTHQFATFLTDDHVDQLTTVIKKYQTASTGKSFQESFLTLMIKKDQMSAFLKMTRQMLEDGSFQSSSVLLKTLIKDKQLEETLKLMVKLLKVST